MIAGSPIFPLHQNVMLTLLLGLLACKAWDEMRRWRLALILLGLGMLTFPDYGVMGVATVLMFHIFRGKRLWQLVFLVIINWFGFEGRELVIGSLYFPVQAFAIFAWIPISLYNGEKGGGSGLQIASYVFYPLHMLILSLLALLG